MISFTLLDTQTSHYYIFCLAYCMVTVTEIKPGKAPYVEKDNIPGLSGDDLPLGVGDAVYPNEIVQIDECNVWYVIKFIFRHKKLDFLTHRSRLLRACVYTLQFLNSSVHLVLIISSFSFAC